MGSINIVGEHAAITDLLIARVKVATGRSEDSWQIVLSCDPEHVSLYLFSIVPVSVLLTS